jgi:hypothetical protein
MRSIAWDWRTKVPEIPHTISDPILTERNAIAQLDTAKLFALFKDDPIAQIVLQQMLEGAKGQDAQNATGLGKTQYESKRKKIHRRLDSSPWKR